MFDSTVTDNCQCLLRGKILNASTFFTVNPPEVNLPFVCLPHETLGC